MSDFNKLYNDRNEFLRSVIDSDDVNDGKICNNLLEILSS